MNDQKVMFKTGLKDSVAIVAGFIPACFTFGLVGKGLGLGSLEVFLLSALVFAGASQFIGVKMLAAGAAAPMILLLTLIINLRYLFISLSFGGQLNRNISVLARTWIGFSLTEEVYAVSMIPREEGNRKSENEKPNQPLGLPYLLGLQIPPYVANLLATASGITLASYIPALYLPALNTSLYALLIALVVPQLKGSLRNMAICISAAGSSWLLYSLLGNSSILIAMLIGMAVGSLFKAQVKAEKGGIRMTILIIIGMAVITFLFRFVPLLLTNHTNGSSKVQALLEYLPIAVLSALTVPGIIQVDPDVNLVGIAAGTVAVILVLIRKIPLLLVILGSVSAALLVKMLTLYF